MVAKRQGKEKPVKIEQRKVQGPEWGPQVKQTALLASPIYIGQATIDVEGMCNFLGSVSPWKNLKWWTSVAARLQLSFIWQTKENISSRHEGMLTQRREEKNAPACGRERDPWPFGSSFYMFSLPLGLPSVSWASQECCLFYPRSSLRSSGLPLFYFCGVFPSLSFSHRHSGLLFPILTT